MALQATTTGNDPIRQAELILKLYELRRETVMREARFYVSGEFMPRSAGEFVQLVSAGGRQNQISPRLSCRRTKSKIMFGRIPCSTD
ncbi:MAG: hypothetical protein ACR2JB_23810 [Bryobacteraceae bacterium]